MMSLISIMFTKRTTVVIFVFVMTLVLVTANSFASLASAAKTESHKGKKNSLDNGNTPTNTPTNTLISKKDLKRLSDCESKAARNGGLTISQVDDCYNQLFPQDQTSSLQGQQPTSALQGQQPTSALDKIQQVIQPQQQLMQMLREGFPFK